MCVCAILPLGKRKGLDKTYQLVAAIVTTNRRRRRHGHIMLPVIVARIHSILVSAYLDKQLAVWLRLCGAVVHADKRKRTDTRYLA
jgi:hypothetical protein